MASSCTSRSYTNAGSSVSSPKGTTLKVLSTIQGKLSPIRGAQAFHQPERFDPETHLWRLFSLIELTENMRQQGDTTFADLLNALPVGDINKTGRLQKQLEIFNGAKVMLRSNINIEQGLVNDAMSIITEIDWPLFHPDQIYDADIPSVCIYFVHKIGGCTVDHAVVYLGPPALFAKGQAALRSLDGLRRVEHDCSKFTVQ
ncbi:ATP-dependent DNA helicase [Trichonephila clavipes]|nr:ATP-dependent DNA helicase [Trichonephila clavipes]